MPRGWVILHSPSRELERNDARNGSKNIPAAPPRRRPHACLGPAFPLFHCGVPWTSALCWRPAHWPSQPPGWAAIFVKAFGLVAKDQPVLRTLYAKWPWPHFYELPRCVGDGCDRAGRRRRRLRAAAKDRPRGGQGIADRNRRGRSGMPRTAPVEQIPAFRKMLRATALPLPLRRLVWLIGLNIGAPARQLFRQLRGDLGRRLWRWRTPCAEPRAIHPELRRCRSRPDHRCRDPLGSPHYRCSLDRQDHDPAGTGAEHRNRGRIARPTAQAEPKPVRAVAT